MPIRVRAAEKELFVIPDGVVINRDFYASILQKPSDEYVRKLIGIETDDNNGNSEPTDSIADFPF